MIPEIKKTAIEKMIDWLEKEAWFMGNGYKELAIKKAKELLNEQNKINPIPLNPIKH